MVAHDREQSTSGAEAQSLCSAGAATEEAAEKPFASAAPKGVDEKERLAASLKRCPDTNLDFFRSL
jgi:hypothetical protein